MSRNAWDFYIALEHREIDEALSHWGQYWRVKGSPLAQCESIEGTYRSPQEWHEPPPPKGWTEADPAVAVRIETVMQQWAQEGREGAKNRRALKFWYVHRSDPEYIRKRLQVKLHQVQPLLYDGRQEVMTRLQSQKKTVRVTGQSELVSGKPPRLRPMGGRSVLCKTRTAPRDRGRSHLENLFVAEIRLLSGDSRPRHQHLVDDDLGPGKIARARRRRRIVCRRRVSNPASQGHLRHPPKPPPLVELWPRQGDLTGAIFWGCYGPT